jgi:hypothetical protein
MAGFESQLTASTSCERLEREHEITSSMSYIETGGRDIDFSYSQLIATPMQAETATVNNNSLQRN